MSGEELKGFGRIIAAWQFGAAVLGGGLLGEQDGPMQSE
jgi:hypothetical protein